MKNTFMDNFLTGNTSVTLVNSLIHIICLFAVFVKFLFMGEETNNFYDDENNKAPHEPQNYVFGIVWGIISVVDFLTVSNLLSNLGIVGSELSTKYIFALLAIMLTYLLKTGFECGWLYYNQKCIETGIDIEQKGQIFVGKYDAETLLYLLLGVGYSTLLYTISVSTGFSVLDTPLWTTALFTLMSQIETGWITTASSFAGHYITKANILKKYGPFLPPSP